MFEEEVVKYKDADNFMEVVPVGMWERYYRDRYIRDELDMIHSALPMKIIRSSGIEVEKDYDITVTDLNHDKGTYGNKHSGTKYKHFHGSGDGGITFKVDVAIKFNKRWGYIDAGMSDVIFENGNKHITDARVKVWWDFWYTHMYPLYIVSDAIDVPNGMYILSKNATRKQTTPAYTVWSLEFTTYNPFTLKKFDAWESVSKYTGKTNAKNTTLKDCLGLSNNFIYSPDKMEGTTTQCTRWLQAKLYELGFMEYDWTGWYNNDVYNAVMRFQEKFQYYFEGMKVTGLMDEVTLKAICSM